MLLAIILFFTAVFMCVVGVLKENTRSVIKHIKIGFATVPLFILGLVLGTFGMPTYWERQTSSTEEENKEIMENIQRNQKIAEEERKKQEEAAREEMQIALRTPEESKAIAKTYEYGTVINNIEQLSVEYLKFEGVVTDIVPSEAYTYLELTLNDNSDHVVVVEFPGPVNKNLGDSAVAYGFLNDGGTYTTDSGNEVYAPILRSDIIE